MTLTPQWLDELRARTTLSTLIGRSVKLQKAGREFRACCPFHNEKSPSFYVNDEKGFYHCFGCSAHGDAIRWMTDQRGLPFIDAVKELASAAGMEVPQPDRRSAERAERAAGLHGVMAEAAAWFQEQLGGVAGGDARAYLDRRGIRDATRAAFGIGFAPDSRGRLKAALAKAGNDALVEAGLLIQVEEKEPYDRFRGRLMIPIRDARGRTIAFGGRIIDQGEPKYLNSPDTPLFDKGRTLFNLDRASAAARKAGRVIVVEGYMDVIALHQAGIEEAVAPLGTALTEAQLERLWRMADVPILCFDGDAAGQKAAIRAAHRALPMLAPGRSLAFATLPPGQDPDDLVRSGEAETFENILKASTSLEDFLWGSSVALGDVSSPEGRAALGRGLRELARSIADEDVRTQYLASFEQRFHDTFVEPPKRPNARSSRSAKGSSFKRSANPYLLAVKHYGMAQAIFAPAALEGLRRFPTVISSHAESLGRLRLLLAHKDLRRICEEMLYAALGQHPLSRDDLDQALRQAGLAPELGRASARVRVPFSFVRDNSDPERAARDLSSVLEILDEAPEIEAALAEATARLKDEWTEAALAEQMRLHAARDAADRRLAELAQVDGAAE